MIISLAFNVKCEDGLTYLRPKQGVGIAVNTCGFGNLTTDQGMFPCIEKCDQMPEVKTLHQFIYWFDHLLMLKCFENQLTL